MPMRFIAAIVMGILAWPLDGHAASACRAESGAKFVPLVELYTSEGCDSCPAADRWLSMHFPAGRPGDAIALAFHVDYWDRLGWKDRFASPAYTARQSDAMRTNRATFAYTPQVVLQGRDFTGWRRGSPKDAIATAATRAPRAWLAMDAALETNSVAVRADVRLDEALRSHLVVAIAYADSRLASDVKSGENRGVRLTHDHVVRAFESRPLTSTNATVDVRLRRPSEAGEHPADVVFVQDVASGDVLQSVALPLNDCR